MITFECKQCGAAVEADEKQTTAVCRYCNLLQTFDPNQKLHRKLMAHANRLRREMEYDRAMEMYDGVLREDPENAEAHWCKMLCRFGVAYVSDPKNGKNVPTCNRMSETSVFADPDYQDCIECADPEAQMLYEDDAKKIEQIRKTYYNVAQNLAPYDVFISFKDTDGDVRTRDSALAEEVYHLLTGEGYRVFFSRISLKDVVGEDYEPYIYAALQSARVMLVVGTRSEYIEAVWVKNEWSRYLRLVAAEPGKRLLIPLTREMQLNELPKELSAYEGYDLGNWRFKDSLLSKVADFCNKKEALSRKKESGKKEEERVHFISAENLFTRAELEIEAGNLEKAGKMVDRGLDLDPQNSKGYWLQLLVYTDNFRRDIENDEKAKKIYDRACRLASDQKRMEYEAVYKTCQAKCLWRTFEANQEAEVISEEQLNRFLAPARKSLEMDDSHKERREQMEAFERKGRASILRKEIQKKYTGKDSEYANKVNQLEQELQMIRKKGESETAEAHFLPFLLPAFALLLSLFYGTANPVNGEYSDLAMKGINAFILIAFVVAAALSSKGILKKGMVVLCLALGGWKLFTAPDMAKTVWLYAALVLILLLFTVIRIAGCLGAGAQRRSFLGRQKALKKTLKKWDQEYTASLEEAGKKYPEEVFERNYECCESPYSGDEFCYYRTKNNRSPLLNIGKCLVSFVCFAAVLGGMVAADSFLLSKSLELKWSDIVLLDAGPWHVVGKKSDGSFVSAGDGSGGRTDVSDWSGEEVASVFCGAGYTAAILENGKVLTTAETIDTRKLTDVKAIATASGVIICLKNDGTVTGAGDNGCGQLNTEGWTDIVQVAASGNGNGVGFTAGLRSDGTVVTTGTGIETLKEAENWTDIVYLAAGREFLAGLRSDGTAVMAGNVSYDLSGIRGAVSMTAANEIAFLDQNGNMTLAGDTAAYQGDAMENLTMVVNGNNFAAGLRPDGTVASVYNPDAIRIDTSGWTDVQMLVSGLYNLYGIQSDGTVLVTGDNADGCCYVGAVPVELILKDWLLKLPVGKLYEEGAK